MGQTTTSKHCFSARSISIVTEYALVCQTRDEFCGDRIIEMNDEQAGVWIKALIQAAIESARSDDRVSRSVEQLVKSGINL